MIDKGFHVADAKVVAGTVATALSATAPNWTDVANPAAQFVVTVVVGGLTAWYTWERIKKIRKENDND